MLKVISTKPEEVFRLENIFFDIHGYMEDESLRCDRICHLIIDCIGYFGSKDDSDKIIGDVFEAIGALLRK